MRRSIPILLGFWIKPYVLLSLISLSACQNRAPSLRMLDTRSGYSSGMDEQEVALYQRGKQNPASFARKSAPRVVRVYIYPHELPTKDFFLGGWVSLVVSRDEWVFNPEDESLPTGSSVEQSQGPYQPESDKQKSSPQKGLL